MVRTSVYPWISVACCLLFLLFAHAAPVLGGHLPQIEVIPDEDLDLVPHDDLQEQALTLRYLILGYSPDSFVAPSPQAANIRQRTLLLHLSRTFRHIGAADYQAAIDLLECLLLKSDGNATPADWIVDDPSTSPVNEPDEAAKLTLALISDLMQILRPAAQWTSMESFRVGGATYLLLLNRDDGVVHIHAINHDGTLGHIVAQYHFSSGWTLVDTYRVQGQPYLFLLKKSDGTAHIRPILSDGTLGDIYQRYNWSGGWTTATFYTVNGQTYLFVLKESDGVMVIYEMNSDGSVGNIVQGGRLAAG